MNRTLLHAYQRLPTPVRSLLATVRGYQLRWWRSWPEDEAPVEEALAKDRWTAAALRSWQDGQLARQLDHAARHVPYYRDHWQKRRQAGDQASWEVLANWPVLTKDEVRATPEAFVAETARTSRLFHEHTSGTSGKPLNLWFSRATLHAYYSVYDARIRRWNGIGRTDRWANIGGQQVVPFERTRPPFWVWNGAMHQLYMSSYHLADQFVESYLEALRTHDIVYLLGYSSSLHSLAELASARGLACPPMRAVITNAEPLYAHQRQAMERAFGPVVRETYGLSEMTCGASECSSGTLHLWPEVGVVEVFADGAQAAVPDGEVGRLVCTGLVNPDMPLIRYETGDRGALALAGTCGCGRALPALKSLEGRVDDVLVTPDGRKIGRLDPVFKSDLPIREAQIVQESVGLVRVLIVPTESFTERDERRLVDSVRDRMGDIEVKIERVPLVPRGANGKFRAVISRIPRESRR